MPTQKLTTRSLAVKPPASGTLELWDKVVPGLALRVSYGGTRSWSVMTRVNGRQIRRKIGTVHTHSLAEARDAARDVIRDAAKGIDPRSNVEQARQESDRAAADTFQAVAEAWLRDDGKYGARNLKSRALIESRLERLVHPKIGSLPIASIAKQDVRRLVEKLAQEYPIGANRTLADIRCVFRWAVAKDKIAHSPVVGLESPADEKSRERVLENAEIAKLWPAFDTLGYPFGPAFKLLLLTGARRNEISALTWQELDLD